MGECKKKKDRKDRYEQRIAAQSTAITIPVNTRNTMNERRNKHTRTSEQDHEHFPTAPHSNRLPRPLANWQPHPPYSIAGPIASNLTHSVPSTSAPARQHQNYQYPGPAHHPHPGRAIAVARRGATISRRQARCARQAGCKEGGEIGFRNADGTIEVIPTDNVRNAAR